jgi:hypothetical protein
MNLYKDDACTELVETEGPVENLLGEEADEDKRL